MAPHLDPASFNHKFVMTNGQRYHYVEEGDPKGEPLLLVHGFPDIWYGWRYQIKYLAKLGYRVIAIDGLGYGQTDSPMELEKFGLKSICTHLVGILDALDIPKVTLIGHDWGGAVVWRFGLYYPNRLHGIISICTPYNPPADKFRTLEEIVKAVPEFEYQLAFADPSNTVKMDAKVHDILNDLLSTTESNKQDLEYMVQQYRSSGFRGPLNYYKTTRVNWEDEHSTVSNKNIDLPCWIIMAKHDIYLKPERTVKMKHFMPNLKSTMIESGHFAMVEKPDEVNQTLKDCLEDLLVRRDTVKASL
ncbi:Bifunctional epoxide hydrolase 2 [Mortierella claussenii]|nr:Bifunctional epoxide hydrolase 2 [Mortierella claussenii]